MKKKNRFGFCCLLDHHSDPRARTLDDTPVSIGYIYKDRVGDWPSFLSLIPGKSYKLRTSETCDVTGDDLFLYDIYLNYTFG